MSLSGRRTACALLIAGLAAMLFGVWRGEDGVILQKTVLLCLECIGIG